MPIIVDSGSTPSSIISYATLEASIASWLHRSDLSTIIADLIVFGEQRIYRDLRVRQMETSFTLSIASGVIAVPDAYLEMKHCYVNTTPVQWLSRKNAEWIYAEYPTRSADGTPKFIAREGANFIFGPYPDSAYTVKGVYYEKLDALSDSNPTNWLIYDAPDLLLFAALCEAAPYIGQDARVALWEKKYAQIRARIQAQDNDEEFSGSPLAATQR